MLINRKADWVRSLVRGGFFRVHSRQSLKLLVACAALAYPLDAVRADIFGFNNLQPSLWTSNKSDAGSSIGLPSPDKIQITNLGSGQARSVFYNIPQPLTPFEVTFTYEAKNAQSAGNGCDYGATLTIQNDPRGASALGGNTANLGYGGILKSAAVTFHTELNRSAFYTGGVLGGGAAVNPINFRTGHPIDVSLRYDGNILSLVFVDTVTSDVYPYAFPADLATLLGGPTGYIGFTASTRATSGDGCSGRAADQFISNFSYRSLSPTRRIVRSDPPSGMIDARTPLIGHSSNPTGWRKIAFEFDGPAGLVHSDDFTISQQGGTLPPPAIESAEHVGEYLFVLTLDRPLEVQTWTTITHVLSGTQVRLGYLPGDVNSDKTTSPSDILALIDFLNGIGPARSIWSSDIDRSGIASPGDILQLIDLLNGAGNLESYNGVQLP